VSLRGAAKLLAAKILWRSTALPAAGRALVGALASNDQNDRTIAGMFLVQLGRNALPLLREALAQGRNVAMVLQIAADIGAHEFEPDMRRYAESADPQIARAAHEALRVLAAQEQR
jgi:hypothetical protein